MPIAMKVHSMRRAVTYPSERTLEVPPEDRIHHECRADVRDDQKHLADRAEAHARVAASAGHELHRVQHRAVEEHPCDREDERGEVKHAEDHCGSAR